MLEPGPTSSRVAYLMSWYPAVTETFILHEMLELRRLGMDVEIFPLFGAAANVRHPGSDVLAPRVHYHGLASLELLGAQLYWLVRRPIAYLRAWARALRGNASSFDFLWKAALVVPHAATIARRIRRMRLGHVHAHWATHPTLGAYVVRELTGASYSFTVHAHDLYLDRAMLAEKIAAARFVVTISRYNRALLERHFGRAAAAKTLVIHCGVDPRLFRPRAPRRGDGVFRFACVAGMRDYKGHRWLVQACSLLAERGIPFHGVFVGDGPERRGIEACIAAAGLADRIELLGNQPQDRIPAVLDGVDAMVLPSVRTPAGMMDGIPVALMEAMAMGLPVVATPVSGIPELVVHGRTGLLAAEKDAGALADALERLHRDPALARRLAEEGRRHVLERFNLRLNVARLRAQLAAAANREPLPRDEEAAPLAPVRVPALDEAGAELGNTGEGAALG
jgi:colanic acid/amylovoran biosynthesis glycosyltransferase